MYTLKRNTKQLQSLRIVDPQSPCLLLTCWYDFCKYTSVQHSVSACSVYSQAVWSKKEKKRKSESEREYIKKKKNPGEKNP